MARAWSKKAVFMLNVGPRAFGDIHPEEQQVLREIGQNLRAYRMI
ncbi:MAG: alpha-L-fucosidase [Anaerolineae bacterium]